MYVAIVYFISEVLIFLFYIPTVFYFFLKKNWQMLVKIFFALIITAAIRRLASIIWYEPRPFVINPTVLLYPTSLTVKASSFFSSHASSIFSLAGIVFWYQRKLGIMLMVGATLVALGRFLAGLHYPQDVILGGIAGLLVSYLVEKSYTPLKKRLKYFSLSRLCKQESI